MTQGTISILFGCHSPVHSLLVVLAWRRLYGRWPCSWETVCIFLHDIGHAGKNYLDHPEEKRRHWRLGARIAYILFGRKGYRLIAGHCKNNPFPKSPLFKADKYSWILAPKCWLYSNTLFEPKLRMGYERMEAVNKFKGQVRENWKNGLKRSTHDLYLERCNGYADNS